MRGQSRRKKALQGKGTGLADSRAAIAVAVLLISCILFTGINLLHSQAEEKTEPYYKYYTSIQIQEGDSLWSIAEDYREHTGKSTAEYVHDLRSMNSLTDDTIHAGNYLTVYYYDTELK